MEGHQSEGRASFAAQLQGQGHGFGLLAGRVLTLQDDPIAIKREAVEAGAVLTGEAFELV